MTGLSFSGFGEILRQELHGTGVSATILYPGRVDTPLIDYIKVPWISAKISPQAVARTIDRSVETHPAEIIVPAQALLLHIFQFISPSLADWSVRFFHLQGWESTK